MNNFIETLTSKDKCLKLPEEYNYLENLLAVGNSNNQPFSLIYTYCISILVVSVLTAYLQFFSNMTYMHHDGLSQMILYSPYICSNNCSLSFSSPTNNILLFISYDIISFLYETDCQMDLSFV